MSEVGHLTGAGPEVATVAGAPVEVATAVPVVHPASRWTRLGRLVMTGERFAVGAALGLWIADAVLIAVARGGATWTQWALGVGSAAFVALSTALVLGAVLGPGLVPAARALSERVGAGWKALREGDVGARHSFLAAVLALPFVLAAWGAVTYRVMLAVVFGFARPDTMAAAMTAATAALAVALVVTWMAAVGVVRWLIEGASRVRGLRGLVARAWPLPTLLGSITLAGAILVASIFRKELATLPWLEAAPIFGLVGGLAIAAYLPAAPSWMRKGLLGLTVAVFAAGFAAALRLRPESSKAQSIAFDRALSGRVGYAAWVFAMDFDRDGQISMLGGGDCAPFDPQRYTGAPDRPGNRIDEDCDGADLPSEALRFRPPLSIKPGTLPGKPTVVFVTIDALAAPKLAAIGGEASIMPRLDELASRSMLFTHCFSQGPSTRMSFPSILTSRWDSQLAFEYAPRLPYSFSEKERTLQDAFDDAGYDTVAVIPNAYFDPARWMSVTRGFQRVDTSALHANTGKHDAREVTDAALAALSEEREKPLYMWVHYFDAHPPYGPPPGVKPPDRDDRTYYAEELAYIDRQLGRLIDAVDHRPEPLYLIVTSDHATSFYPIAGVRHWNYGYDIYTSTLHVPLIVHGPGLRTGQADHVVSTMDVAPTMANLFNLNTKVRFEGTSLAPELLDGASDPNRLVFHEYYLPENVFRGHGDPLEFVSLRTDQYDLILNRKHGTYELYDWRADYWEKNDLYEERGRTPEVAHLRSLLAAFVVRYDAAATEAPAAPWRATVSRPGLSAVEP